MDCGAEVKEHMGGYGPERVQCLRQHSTYRQSPAMLGKYLDSQHCLLRDTQLFGKSPVFLLSCLESLLF